MNEKLARAWFAATALAVLAGLVSGPAQCGAERFGELALIPLAAAR